MSSSCPKQPCSCYLCPSESARNPFCRNTCPGSCNKIRASAASHSEPGLLAFQLVRCADFFEIGEISALQSPVDNLLVFGVDDLGLPLQCFGELLVTAEHLREQRLVLLELGPQVSRDLDVHYREGAPPSVLEPLDQPPHGRGLVALGVEDNPTLPAGHFV